MRVNMKHVVEIAGGLIIGSLASEAVNGVGKIVKNTVVKVKEKTKAKKEEKESKKD